MKYTVITINYNDAEGLGHTIESVISQTFVDFEFVVIDGGSTDDSVDTIKRYENRIDFWVSESDKGIYHAMNKGVNHAHGDYCIFMNSGDRFYNAHVLESLLPIVDSADVIVGKVVISESNHVISPSPAAGNFTMYSLYSGAIPHQGAFIKTELLRKYPYDEELKIASDWKFFVQTLIMNNCSVDFVDLYVARYNLDGVSSTNPELLRLEKEKVLASMFPERILADYRNMKKNECLTASLCPDLRQNYGIDRILYRIGKVLLWFRHV